MDDTLSFGKHKFRSRLFVGTGKYPDFATMQRAIEACGAEVVTVAVRRLDLAAKGEQSLLHWIDRSKITLLPNTAGCYTADDAVRTCRLARELGMSDLVKLEVIGDTRTLFPDNEQLLVAAKILVKEGFTVLPYTNDDPVVAKKLEDAGCAAVMPLGAPIGSGLGLRNPVNLRDHPREREGAGDRRRRRGHGLRRGGGHGARLPRRAHEHGHRRGQGSGA